ncbi:MAG: hypothetical protein ACYC5O_03010 [Anaerolineae bacterium]
MAVRDERAEWLRVLIYRRMTAEQRLQIAAEMYDDALEIVADSIRDRRPDIGPDDLRREVRRRVLPPGLPEWVYEGRRPR